MVIVVSGTYESVRQQLLAISAVVKYRKHYGWLPFQSDETWLYESEQDENVCPTCQEFESTEYFSGDAILHNFPTEEQIDPLHHVHPRVHQAHPERLGECRCSLSWLNSVITLAERLFTEMVGAI